MKLLETKTIKIGDKVYSLKLSVRAMISYETLSGKLLNSVETIQDRVYLFYSCFTACNPDVTYDQFMDLIDTAPEKIGEFINLIFDSAEKKPKAR